MVQQKHSQYNTAVTTDQHPYVTLWEFVCLLRSNWEMFNSFFTQKCVFFNKLKHSVHGPVHIFWFFLCLDVKDSSHIFLLFFCRWSLSTYISNSCSQLFGRVTLSNLVEDDLRKVVLLTSLKNCFLRILYCLLLS